MKTLIAIFFLFFSFSVSADDSALYEPKGKTFSEVFTTFETSVLQSPIVIAAGNFLVFSLGSGSCPVWSASVPLLGVNFALGDYFCGVAITAALRVVGVTMLIIALYFSVRIAFL